MQEGKQKGTRKSWVVKNGEGDENGRRWVREARGRRRLNWLEGEK